MRGYRSKRKYTDLVEKESYIGMKYIFEFGGDFL